MHSLVLWSKAEPKTSSVISNRLIKTKKSISFGKWGNDWHEIEIITSSADVEYLESLNVDVCGRIMTPERRKSFPNAVIAKKREMASKKRKAAAAASSKSAKLNENLIKTKSIFSDSSDEEDKKETCNSTEKRSHEDEKIDKNSPKRTAQIRQKDGEVQRENENVAPNIVKRHKKCRVQPNTEKENDNVQKIAECCTDNKVARKGKNERCDAKVQKKKTEKGQQARDETNQQEAIQRREKLEHVRKETREETSLDKGVYENEKTGRDTEDASANYTDHHDDSGRSVDARNRGKKVEPLRGALASGRRQEVEPGSTVDALVLHSDNASIRGQENSRSDADEEVRSQNNESHIGTNAIDADEPDNNDIARDNDDIENQEPNIPNIADSFVSNRPEEGKLQLIKGIPIYVDAVELNIMKMRWRAKPEEFTRRLMKLIVGKDNLKKMTPTGRAKTDSIPPLVYKAVFLFVNKKIPEGQDKLQEIRYRRVLTNMCNTLRNPKKSR